MSNETMFQEAIQALSQGQHTRARDLFTRLLKRDSSNPEYWLWMSAVVETTPECIYCLENVLQLEPTNQAAQRGLVVLGARQADDHLPPAPLIKRKWTILTPVKEPGKPVIQRLVANRFVQVVGIICALIILTSLVYFSKPAPAPQSSPTTTFIVVAITAMPTRTASPTPTPNRTITPSVIGATPLWAFLESTYTPRPVYVNTPHPILEAYKIALRSYDRRDYARMISYLEQALREEPLSTDITYLLGEGYRLVSDFERALELYEKAIELNAYFAPPYLGRALVNWEIHPGQDISPDLEKAIELDPYLAEAYLALAEYQIENANLDGAYQNLENLQSIIPDADAPLYWLEARLLLAQEDFPAALAAAQNAKRLDQTMLPVYLTLAQALLANDRPEAAIEQVQIFLRYEPEHPLAWLTLAQAQYSANADRTTTLKSLRIAIELNPENSEIYWYRGRILLESGDSQAAINDLLRAVHLDGASFQYNLDFGRALYAAERYTDAYRQLNVTERLAEEDANKAAVFYWRARTLESAQNMNQAKSEWNKLLSLPIEVIPVDWLTYARERLLALESPTPTATMTPIPSVKITTSPTP